MYDHTLPYLETPRLILREIEIEDYIDMFEYASLPSVGPSAGWHPHFNTAETRRIISSMIDKRRYGQLGTFAIVLKKNNKMIGTLELHTYTPKFKAELGYTINPKFQGNGYAYEASLWAIDWAFRSLLLQRIECSSFINNIASQRVCEKLHFTYESIRKKGYQLYDGSIHDIKCYAITDNEYFSSSHQNYLKTIEFN